MPLTENLMQISKEWQTFEILKEIKPFEKLLNYFTLKTGQEYSKIKKC